MNVLKQAVLKLVKDGVVVQNKIKAAIPGVEQADVLNALSELVRDGELSVTNNRVKGNVYAINFRQPLPPLEEGVPTIPPTTDSFPDKEPFIEEVPQLPTPEDLAELNRLAGAAESTKALVVPPVVDVVTPFVDNNPVEPEVKKPTEGKKK